MILSKPSLPSILLLNARSLPNKLDELRALTASCLPDCIAITETWLTNEISDDYLSIKNFIFFRSDRQERIGGGVCMYIHQHFRPEFTQQMILQGIESLTVRLQSTNLVLWCLYIPPNLPALHHQLILDGMINHFDTLLDSSPDTKFIICGDFNDFQSNAFHRNFLCVNRVTSPTRGNSLLDQIWISEVMEENYPEPAEIGSPLGSSDHNCVVLRPAGKPEKEERIIKTVYDFRQTHIQNFLKCLASLSFKEIYAASDVNKKCDAFYRLFFEALSVILQRKVCFTARDKPWITPVLKKLIEDRWDAYRMQNWPVFNHLKLKVKHEITRAKQAWSEKILRRDKHIWNVVRDFQGKKRRFNFPNNDKELLPFISKLSSSFQTYLNEESDADPCLLTDENWSIHINAPSVHQLLTRLRLKQSPGFDAIPAHLLKISAEIICEPLSEIFRSSLQSRVFPNSWKNSLLRPIPKKSNPTADDFRPISLLPIVSKLFEKLVLSSMKKVFLLEFGRNQHAFRPLGSSTSALIDIHDTITTFLEKPENFGVRVSCLDFSKAFDKLQHNRLVNLLKEKGFNQGFLLWLRSYLTGRSQRVSVNNRLGQLIPLRSGVPQGSVLGPYLFAIFIASLDVDADGIRLVKYADDLTLIESLTSQNLDLNTFEKIKKWTGENKMQLNPKKCQQVLVNRVKNHSIPCYSDFEVKPTALILGVTLSNNLSWRPHFNRVILTANRRLHILRVLKPFIPKDKLVEVFRASILAVILYASPVFGPLSHSIKKNIDKLIKRSHRIICDPSCTCSLIPDFKVTRDKLAKDFFLKCELLDHPLHLLVPPRMIFSNKFRMPFCSTSRRQKSFFPSTCMLINNVNF